MFISILRKESWEKYLKIGNKVSIYQTTGNSMKLSEIKCLLVEADISVFEDKLPRPTAEVNQSLTMFAYSWVD